ncbi:MAG TPA: ATP-binding protein [Candidatus Angelobacter sp.]|nr:ATP-binding protein [Candidatus Angelobacter sp.]HKT50564.1 ATP-binding protein [Candidatus Angelobacter sp.]
MERALEPVFGRMKEVEELRRRFADRRTFLFHGESGAGKSLLVRSLWRDFPKMIYCQADKGMQDVCRQLALRLLESGNPTMKQKFGRRPGTVLSGVSIISLRGIVAAALKEAPYLLVLDHFSFASQQFAALLKSWISESTPVVVIARSNHMEEIGYASTLFVERKERLMLADFAPEAAREFIDWRVQNSGLAAENLDEFKQRLLSLSGGNPGVISWLVRLAALPKYRSGEQIKVTPLYLDFKIHGMGAIPQ